jgi:hypothetical protein
LIKFVSSRNLSRGREIKFESTASLAGVGRVGALVFSLGRRLEPKLLKYLRQDTSSKAKSQHKLMQAGKSLQVTFSCPRQTAGFKTTL